MLRVGILGGTFDPVHNGHIEIAKKAKALCQLDQVWLMPNSVSPFKVGKKTASAVDRLKMIELAISDLKGFEVSTLEVFKEEVSYTYDTMKALVEKNKDTEFYFIIGADQAASLDKWYQYEKLSKIVKFVVFKREGYDIPDYEFFQVIDNDLIDVSSTHEKKSGFNQLNPLVRQYILERKIYD